MRRSTWLVGLALSSIEALRVGASPRALPRAPPPSCAANGALLFDCDGVIVETEELHRLAYNSAFQEFGLEVNSEAVEWTVPYYDKLQNTVGGGKPKMRWHFLTTCNGVWPTCTKRGGRTPASEEEGMALIDELQDCKTEAYKKIVDQAASPRPGVLELMDAAIADPNLAVGICSAATRGGFERVVNSIVGAERLAKLDVVIAGDDIQNKKPDPEIYNVAAERLGLSKADCVVIEDSLVGLRAATGAGMKCLVTYTPSTAAEDFYGEGAAATVPDLGVGVTLAMLFSKEGRHGHSAVWLAAQCRTSAAPGRSCRSPAATALPRGSPAPLRSRLRAVKRVPAWATAPPRLAIQEGKPVAQLAEAVRDPGCSLSGSVP